MVRECRFFNILAEFNFTVFLYYIKAKEVIKLSTKTSWFVLYVKFLNFKLSSPKTIVRRSYRTNIAQNGGLFKRERSINLRASIREKRVKSSEADQL